MSTQELRPAAPRLIPTMRWQACPHCGLAPHSRVTIREGSIFEANYLCPNQHSWQMKTMEAPE